MDRAELLQCMREAADALAEFRRFIPAHCPEAAHHLEQALLHFDVALALYQQRSGVLRDEDDDLPPRLRFNR